MKPSRSQLKMLHLLDQGVLTFHSWPRSRFEVHVDGQFQDQGWQFHEATAKLLVERKWVEMKGFSAKHGDYFITAAGRELIGELCPNWLVWAKGEASRLGERRPRPHGLLADDCEVFAGKLLCRKCGRVVPCVSVKTPAHGANLWNWQWGTICNEHYQWLRRRA